LSTLPIVFAAKAVRDWLPFMKFAVFLCLMIIIINMFFSRSGEHVIYRLSFNFPLIGFLKITQESVLFGVGMSIRLTTLISAFTILTLTVHPDDLMLTMIKLRLPYKSVLLTSLSTRFVPTLIKDVETVTDAYRSRGVKLDKGSFSSKIKNRMPIVIALFSNSLERAIQVAEAMEARAFGSKGKRTFYKEINISRIDYVILASSLTFFCLSLMIRLSGYGEYQYYPSIKPILLNSWEIGAISTIFILASTIVFLSPIKRRFDLD
jgi:energy-coupling factor transport system permease protein